MGCIFEENAIVLFQGDSITDAGRDRNNPFSMGSGYAMMAASQIAASFPNKGITFLNRGVSGNRVDEMARRWQTDCIDLKPSWISIMIGINDTWQNIEGINSRSISDYARDFRSVLEHTANELNASLILIDPFVVPHSYDNYQWRPNLNERIEIVHKLAEEFDATLIRMDDIMQNANDKHSPEYLTTDGVHPTPSGHTIMAESWIETVTTKED